MATRVTTLTDQVAQRIKDCIETGIYAVGSKLPSGKELGEIYGVSQAVIREVTERLRSQGLIDSRQGSGCVVKSRIQVTGFKVPDEYETDHAELSSVFELRLDLEGAAAALAAIRRTEADIAAMDAILDELAQNLHNLDVGVELDVAFHTAVAAATHNRYYSSLLNYLGQQLRKAVHAARFNALTHTPLLETVQLEHIKILKAIRAGDPEAARAAAISHLKEAALHLGIDLPRRTKETDTLVEAGRRKTRNGTAKDQGL